MGVAYSRADSTPPTMPDFTKVGGSQLVQNAVDEFKANVSVYQKLLFILSH